MKIFSVCSLRSLYALLLCLSFTSQVVGMDTNDEPDNDARSYTSRRSEMQEQNNQPAVPNPAAPNGIMQGVLRNMYATWGRTSLLGTDRTEARVELLLIILPHLKTSAEIDRAILTALRKLHDAFSPENISCDTQYNMLDLASRHRQEVLVYYELQRTAVAALYDAYRRHKTAFASLEYRLQAYGAVKRLYKTVFDTLFNVFSNPEYLQPVFCCIPFNKTFVCMCVREYKSHAAQEALHELDAAIAQAFAETTVEIPEALRNSFRERGVMCDWESLIEFPTSSRETFLPFVSGRNEAVRLAGEADLAFVAGLFQPLEQYPRQSFCSRLLRRPFTEPVETLETPDYMYSGITLGAVEPVMTSGAAAGGPGLELSEGGAALPETLAHATQEPAVAELPGFEESKTIEN